MGARLLEYKSKLLIFPKRSGKKGVKKGDTPRDQLQNVAQNTLKEIIPIERKRKRSRHAKLLRRRRTSMLSRPCARLAQTRSIGENGKRRQPREPRRRDWANRSGGRRDSKSSQEQIPCK